MIMVHGIFVRRIDKFGRVLLPLEWRRKYLKKTRLITMEIRDGELVIRPLETPDLTCFFDSIEVDVDPEVFEDYNKLKKALLRGQE